MISHLVSYLHPRDCNNPKQFYCQESRWVSTWAIWSTCTDKLIPIIATKLTKRGLQRCLNVSWWCPRSLQKCFIVPWWFDDVLDHCIEMFKCSMHDEILDHCRDVQMLADDIIDHCREVQMFHDPWWCQRQLQRCVYDHC